MNHPFTAMVALRNQKKPVLIVIPAKAGIQINLYPIWIPACAGMTDKDKTCEE